jgi:ribosomal protein L37AE/L43A
MATANRQTRKVGDCETCERTNIALTLEDRNMWMCEFCVADERAITTKIGEANVVLSHSKEVDTSIQMKPEIFVSKTVAIVELHAAIMHDANISDDMKDVAYTKACDERYLHLKGIVFAKRAELNDIEQEMRAWQVNAQAAAGKLRGSEREKYRHLDVNYTPTAPIKKLKSVKSDKPKSKSAYNRTETIEAATKYGVPFDGIRNIQLSKNMTADEAGRYLATLLKKSLPQ